MPSGSQNYRIIPAFLASCRCLRASAITECRTRSAADPAGRIRSGAQSGLSRIRPSAVLQAAINKVQETGGEGIVFVPSGRYRLTTTVYVWGGIRIIGYGVKRPVLVLAANTPGCQQDRGADREEQIDRRQQRASEPEHLTASSTRPVCL